MSEYGFFCETIRRKVHSHYHCPRNVYETLDRPRLHSLLRLRRCASFALQRTRQTRSIIQGHINICIHCAGLHTRCSFAGGHVTRYVFLCVCAVPASDGPPRSARATAPNTHKLEGCRGLGLPPAGHQNHNEIRNPLICAAESRNTLERHMGIFF